MGIRGWIAGLRAALTVFCFSRVLRKPIAAGHMHAPLDINTHDQNT